MSHSSCRPRSPGQNPLLDMHASPPGRPTRPPRGVRLRAARSTFHQSYTGICTRQDRRCPVNWVFSRGPNGASCPSELANSPTARPRSSSTPAGVCRPFEQVPDPGRVLRGPQVRKKAASAGRTPHPAAARPGQAAPSCPRPPPCPSLLAPSLARELRASLPPGGCRPGVGGFAVADAPHGQGSPRRRRRSAGSLNVTAERATAAPDPFCACFRPYPRFRCGTRGEMARSMRRNGTAYWRALLMALWSLLNPTHPQ